MSKVGVIVALVVMLLLAGALWLASGKGTKVPAASGPLLAFDPARAVELRVTRADGTYEAARRGRVPGDWDIILGGAGTEQVWPANPGRVRAALRILSTLEAQQDADGGLEPGAPEFAIKMEGGATRAMRVSAKPLGGRVLVQVQGTRSAWVTQDIGDMLVGTGIKEWRERSAFPGLGPETSRITLKGEKGAVALARVQGKWGVREPVQEAAEADAIVKLITVLQNVEVTDFLDAGQPERTGLDTPVATITVEADQRDADGTLHTSSRTLAIGQQADIAGKAVFASMRWGTEARTVTVAAERLASMTTDAAAYVSRRSINAPESEIGKVEVLTLGTPARVLHVYERTLDGWKEATAGALTPEDAGKMHAALALLTQLPADAVVVGTPPQSWGSAGPDGHFVAQSTVRFSSLGGTPLAELDMCQSHDDPPVIGRGQVWRRYPKAEAPIAAWLMR